MPFAPTRRTVLLGGACLAALPAGAAAPLELDWDALIPDGGGKLYESMRRLGVVQHGEFLGLFDQELGASVTTEYNGRTVRLPGFVVPLDWSGAKVREFLLVPFVGACIHVPPPPPNQIVFVTLSEPLDVNDMWDPVWVTGRFDTLAVATELAEIGYTMAAERVDPYEE